MRSFDHWRCPQSFVRLHNNGVANNHVSHEHLFFSVAIGNYWSETIWVQAVESEIVCLPPHANVWVVQIEAFFAQIDGFWRSLPSAVIQILHISLSIILHLNVFNLIFEYFPQLAILDSLNFINFGSWHCRFEPHFDIFPFLWTLWEIENLAVFLTLDKTQNIVPMRGEVILLDFLDNFCELQLDLFILETNYLDARALNTDFEKILILRIEVSHISHDFWNHRANNRTLARNNWEIAFWIACSVF